jgi:hypothetical protein
MKNSLNHVEEKYEFKHQANSRNSSKRTVKDINKNFTIKTQNVSEIFQRDDSLTSNENLTKSKNSNSFKRTPLQIFIRPPSKLKQKSSKQTNIDNTQITKSITRQFNSIQEKNPKLDQSSKDRERKAEHKGIYMKILISSPNSNFGDFLC